MKVVQINYVYQIGSTGITCKEVSDYLNNSGHECYTFYVEGIKDEYSFKISNKIERVGHALLSRLFCDQAMHSTLETKKLIKKLVEINPDVVIIHNVHSNYIHFKLLMDYLKSRNVKTTLYVHDCWFFTGKCTYYTSSNCYKWKDSCGKCPRLHQDNKSWFVDNTSKMLDIKRNLYKDFTNLKVVTVSDWLLNEVKESILKERTIKRIYNWINFSIFNCVKKPASDKKIILGCASVWDERKGLDKFLALADLLPGNYQIVLIGKQNKHINHDKITYVESNVSQEELAKYYNDADAFFNASLEETFGKVSAESISCGTPVICYNSTANPEIVGEGCGYILDRNATIEDVFDKMKMIIENGKDYYSDNCVKYAQKHFDMETNIKELIKFISE